jgi:DNA-nicking Smr family endonuclease
MGRKKGNRRSGPDGSPRRGKRRSIRYDAAEEWPEDREDERKRDAPPEIHLRKLPLAEALDRLRSQVAAFAKQGRREVLVVHGKGLNSPGGAPVVGPEVRAWCEASPLVASWKEAPARWGGAGAIVVVLRQKGSA